MAGSVSVVAGLNKNAWARVGIIANERGSTMGELLAAVQLVHGRAGAAAS